MFHDFIDPYVVGGFILVTSFIILAACIDRYRSHRWGRILNAQYLARAASQASSFRTFEYQNHERFAEFRWEVEAVHVARGSRSRKRVLRDRLGRVVANHYEQLVIADLNHMSLVKAALLLPPATV